MSTVRHGFRDPTGGVAREASSAVTLANIDQVEPAMRHPRERGAIGFRGADVESSVDLPSIGRDHGQRREIGERDRKSTRLNSSHLGISYAVFCLKKKTRYKA